MAERNLELAMRPPDSAALAAEEMEQAARRDLGGVFRRINLLACFVALALAISLGLVFWSAFSQDAVATSERTRLATVAIESTTAALNRIVGDYSRWDDAFDHLAGEVDEEWALNNIQDNLWESFDVGAVYVVQGGRIKWSHHFSDLADLDLTAAGPAGLDLLLDRAGARSSSYVPPVGGVLRLDGRFYFVSAGRIVRFEGGEPAESFAQEMRSLDFAAPTFLVFVEPVTEDLLSGLADSFLLYGLHVSSTESEPQGMSYGILSPSGETIGYLHWSVEWPSRMVITSVLPGILIVLVGILLLSFFAARALRKSTNAAFEARNRAMLSERVKTEFLRRMSHELRTPLNAIIGFSDIMIAEFGSSRGLDKYVSYAADINEGGQRLLAVINDMLDISKIDSGQYEITEQEVDIAGLLRACSALSSGWPIAGGKMFAVEIAGSLPELWADSRVVRQIVLNLLSNAMKFTPSGGLVTLRCFESAIEGIVVEIEDTGIGISAAELPNLGKAFHQAERTLVRKHEGSGLGLALVQAFVGMHQGRLEISSQEGVGTKARVIFPASRIVRRADAEAEAADSTMQASTEAAA